MKYLNWELLLLIKKYKLKNKSTWSGPKFNSKSISFEVLLMKKLNKIRDFEMQFSLSMMKTKN